ncbi:MAG: HD domain-containing protein, partial [bacterium]
MTIEQIIKKYQEIYPLVDVAVIDKAYKFASEVHKGQKRLNNETMMDHLLQTANNLVNLRLDTATIAAGILHDVLEYTPTDLNHLKKEFGNEIASLVEGVTFIKKVKYRDKNKFNEREAEKIRKILIAMAKDIRVILIKLT